MAIHRDEVDLSLNDRLALDILEREISYRLVYLKGMGWKLEIPLNGSDGLGQAAYNQNRADFTSEMKRLFINRFARAGWTVREVHGCLVFT